jgi:predicted amidophosphoribosyltransferase
MEPQTLINISFGGLLTIVGWLSRQLWDAVERMKADIKNIEITLPSHYARKDDIQSRFDKVEVMLEKIFDKLDLKQDKA